MAPPPCPMAMLLAYRLKSVLPHAHTLKKSPALRLGALKRINPSR
jgi:hypothetical protein